MVEYVYPAHKGGTIQLDLVFGSLSDQTRRDILKRVSRKQLSVGKIASHYKLSFAAVAKHLKVLQQAGLISKTRQGKQQLIAIAPHGLAAANVYLKDFEKHWQQRLDRLDNFLKSK